MLNKNATIELHSKVKSIKFHPIPFFSSLHKIYLQHTHNTWEWEGVKHVQNARLQVKRAVNKRFASC